MENEVKGTSAHVYKVPRKEQEAKNAANNPDVNSKIRAILVSSNHNPDVVMDVKRAGYHRILAVDTALSPPVLHPAARYNQPAAVTSPDAWNPPQETLIHLVCSQAERSTGIFKKLSR